ncbi:MAG: hypothetical protein ACFCU3_02100 [Verrucomicrobiales bacterium]
MKRWWQYFKERFPLLKNGLLIVFFSTAAVSYSRMLRGEAGWPRGEAILVAFVCSFMAFLHLRIADEFKDHAEDLRWRPYRPVPRGLVKLRELAVLALAGAAFQTVVVISFEPWILWVLGLQWLFFLAMSLEFGVGTWLRQRPVAYLMSHMAIMPLIDLVATACDWSPGMPPGGLEVFLAVSFANGLVIELGRKIRSPEDEEDGVQTYSRLWGLGRASGSWLAALTLTWVLAVWAASQIGHGLPVGLFLLVWLVIGGFVVRCFLRSLSPKSGEWLETFSGLWTLALYGALGWWPIFSR